MFGMRLGQLGSAIKRVIHMRSFDLPLQSSLVPSRALGSASPTFTRASTAYQIDFEGKHNLALSGEARFNGARRVGNLIPGKSNDFSGWALGGTATVTGTNQINLPAVGDSIVKNTGVSSVGMVARGEFTASGSGTVKMFLSNGIDALAGPDTCVITLTATPTRYSVIATWGASLGTPRLILVRDTGETATTVILSKAQVTNVTGQSNQNPCEYVSVGVLAAPYDGAGVDGVKYFPYLNGNTVASNVVTEAQGAAIASGVSGVTTNADAKGPYGYITEGARSDVLGTTDVIRRTMSAAGWVATNVTKGTATGTDGTAAIAASLTASGANGTALFTTVLTAAVRTYSAWVRRNTGTGTVSMTVDNSVTWTPINLTRAYQLFQLTTASAANPVVGFKIDTSGDAIEVDFNTIEAATFANPTPVPVNVAKAADAETYINTGNISDTAGTMYAEVSQATWATVSGTVIGSATQGLLPLATNSGVRAFDGTNTVSGTARTPLGIVNMAVSWSGSTMTVCASGETPVSGTYDGSWNLASIGIGTGTYSTIRNVKIWTVALPASTLQAITDLTKESLSLTLDFINSTTLDPRITFTRASSATYFGSDGLLKTSLYNLLTYSQDFTNAAWSKQFSTATANKIIEDATATTSHYVRTSGSLGSFAGGLTLAIECAAAERSIVNLYMDNGSGNSVAYDFDLVAVTATQRNLNTFTSPVASITDVGGGRFLCVLTASRATADLSYGRISIGKSGAAFAFGLPVYSGDGVSGLYVYKSALFEGTHTAAQILAQGGIPLTTTVANGNPRFDYDPATLLPKGLLIEESRTNLAIQSTSTTAFALLVNVTVSAGAGVAPDDTATMSTVTRAVVVSDDRAQRSLTVANNAAAYIYSGYTPVGTSQVVGANLILSGGTAVNNLLYFDRSTGAISSGTGTVTRRGNYWYWTITGTNNTSGNTILTWQFRPNVAGTGTADYWGLQVEVGATASSYIPTTTSAVTRAADRPALPAAGWYNATSGTFVVDFDGGRDSTQNGYGRVIGSNVVTTTAVISTNGTTSSLGWFDGVLSGGSGVIAGADYWVVGGKAAFAYGPSYTAICGKGSTPVNTTNNINRSASNFMLGGSYSLVENILNGHIRSLRFYNTRLPNATLQSLTA